MKTLPLLAACLCTSAVASVAIAQDTSADFVARAMQDVCLPVGATLDDIVAAGEGLGLTRQPLDNPNGVRVAGGGVVITYALNSGGLNCFLRTEGGDLVAYTKALQALLPTIAEAAGASDYFEAYPSNGSMRGGEWSWSGADAFWTVSAVGGGADNTLGVSTFGY